MKFIEEQEKLLEPIKYYKTEFAESFLNKLTDTFQSLLEESKIDIEANRRSVKEHNEISNTKAKANTTLKCFNYFFSIVVFVLIGLIIFEIDNIIELKKLFDMKKSIYDISIKTAITGFFIITISAFNFIYIAGKKRKYIQIISELENKLKQKEDECYSQVSPLLELFDSNMANKFITEIIPTLSLDKYFKIERYADLVCNFEMLEQLGDDLSVKDLISGEILGNPFIIAKTLFNSVVDETYYGSRTVSWTEHYTSNGVRKSKTVRQTLKASIVKPKQEFEEVVRLVYGNSAAANLNFTREPTFIHKYTPRQLAKHLKKVGKEIKKKSANAIKTGESFLEMGNLEFDALFGAINRDNEVDFRVLFTPIAQRNMIELLKDKDFGDDFAFYKTNRLNEVLNGRNWILNIQKSFYNDFSFDAIKEKYNDINQKYFSNFYRLFLPIFTIPIYHQQKSQSYIYNDEFDYNYNSYVSEVMANSLGEELFSHNESTTPSILKTNVTKTEKDTDLIEVVGMSYKEVAETEYVPVVASNGSVYDVPVDWIDYVPLTASGKMELKKVDMEEKHFEKSINNNFLKSIDNKKYAYKNNIFAILTNENEIKYGEKLEMLIDK